MIIWTNRFLIPLAIIFILSFTAESQPISDKRDSFKTVTVPGYFNPERHLQFGDSLLTVITNMDSQAVSFFVPYYYPGLEYIGYSDDSAVAPLRRAGNGINDPDSAKLLMLIQLAQILKSNLHVNALVLGVCSEEKTVSALNSLVGGFNGIYHQQCGLFASQAANMLFVADPNLFNETTLRMASWSGHSVLEVLYRNRWTMFDFDVGMPALSVANPSSYNGLASVADIIKDTSLIKQSSQYYFDGYTFGGDHAMKDYQATFYKGEPHYYPPTLIQQSVSGVQVLCGGCSLAFAAKVSCLAIDTSLEVGRRLLTEGMPYVIKAYSTQNEVYWDSLGMAVQRLYGLPNATARQLFTNVLYPKLMLVIQGEKWWQSPSTLLWQSAAPVCKLIIPPKSLSMEIGRDIYFPFIAVGLNSMVPITIGNSTSTVADLCLWTAGQAKVSLDNNKVNYLTAGNIPAHTRNIEVSMAYNPEAINIFKGFQIQQYNGKALKVTQQFFPSNIMKAVNGTDEK